MTRFFGSKLRLAPVALAIAAIAAPAGADVVTDWNNALLDSVRAAKTNPPVMTRNEALLNVAMFDAVVAISGGFESYARTGIPPLIASPEAAAAAAGHEILSTLYPADAATFDALLAQHLAQVADVVARDSGAVFGEQVANGILASRANDGSTAVVPYAAPTGAYWWIPTPPAFAPPLLPGWGKVTPWAMTSGTQCRTPGPPPSPTEALYLTDFIEVATLGEDDSEERTPEQTEIALFWNDGAGSQTPPGHWNEVAQILAEDAELSLVESARLFALLSITQADASVVAWDNKFNFHNWRPVSAIRGAADDGNPVTQPDETWASLIPTPPFPSYTSGHSTYSGSSSRLLELFFGSNEIPFSLESDGLPGVVRSFETLSEAAQEAGQSRIYGGIHWQYDNTDGLASGRALAEFVFANFLRPLEGEPEECVADANTLCLHEGRFSVHVTWRSNPTTSGLGVAVPRTDQSGEFSFFEPDNVELIAKVLEACDVNDHFWVFTAAATDVEYVVAITDHETGFTRTYFNPLRSPGRATRDIEAFPCE